MEKKGKEDVIIEEVKKLSMNKGEGRYKLCKRLDEKELKIGERRREGNRVGGVGDWMEKCFDEIVRIMWVENGRSEKCWRKRKREESKKFGCKENIRSDERMIEGKKSKS